MGSILRGPGAAASLAAACIALTLSWPATASADRDTIILPVGSVIPVKLDQQLSSKDNRPGDRFTATVQYGRDDAGLPVGTQVEGIVREARTSSEGRPGVLDMDFRRLLFANGDTRPIDASLMSLDNKGVRRTAEGRLVAKSGGNKDRLTWVGIGAGAGLILATLTKGNVLLDTLLGAGAGYLYSELQNKRVGDVTLGAGTEFGVRVDRRFAYQMGDGLRSGAAYRRPRPEAIQVEELRTEREPLLPGEEIGDIGMLIDDRNVRFGADRPFMKNGTVLLPLRSVAREAGFDYTFDRAAGVLRLPDRRARIAVGSRIAIVNGERRRMETSPELRDGVLYVPMRFLALATDGAVYWDALSRTVVLTTRASVTE
jgi:hypothetical protein